MKKFKNASVYAYILYEKHIKASRELEMKILKSLFCVHYHGNWKIECYIYAKTNEKRRKHLTVLSILIILLLICKILPK